MIRKNTMSLTLKNINFINFDDEKKSFTLICLEDYNNKKETYDRSFIAFESLDDMENIDELISTIEKNKDKIHLAIGNMENIEALIDNENIKVTAYTSSYWEDVRLFSGTSKFAYCEDVFNTAAIELEVYKHIKNKYYNKEILIGMCNEENLPEVMAILKKSKFTNEELEETFNNNPSVQKILGINNLYNDLSNNLSKKTCVVSSIKI